MPPAPSSYGERREILCFVVVDDVMGVVVVVVELIVSL